MLCFIFYFIFCTVHWADLSWPTFHYWLYPVWLCMWQINKNLEPWTLRTQDGDLQSGTDRQGPWRSWELRKPWRCRELRRPWWSWELRRPWRSWETSPRRVSMDKTDMMIKIFLWAQQNRHTALLAVTCGLSTGLGIAAASGHESAPIRWAWVSGDPAGMSQQRSGGFESAAIRRALSHRRASGHWIRGGPVAWSPANGAPGGAATREQGNPPAGLGEPPPAADISRDRRAWGLAASGLAAIPPNSRAVLTRATSGMTSGDFLAAGQTDTGTNKKLFKKWTKQNEVKGRRLRLGLVFCHGAHTREEQEHADEDVNSNNNI